MPKSFMIEGCTALQICVEVLIKIKVNHIGEIIHFDIIN